MRRLLAVFAVLALAVSAPRVLSAQDSSAVKQGHKEVRRDRRELRGDRKDIRHDTRDIRQDRRDVRQDLKQGDTADARRSCRMGVYTSRPSFTARTSSKACPRWTR